MRVNKIYQQAIKAYARFIGYLELLEGEFVFVGFDGNEPNVEFVHDDIFLVFEDPNESYYRSELPIEEAIDEMRKNGHITPDCFCCKNFNNSRNENK